MGIFEELSRFLQDFRFLGPPITDDRLEKFETNINYKLPHDFKQSLKSHNGVALFGTRVLGLDSSYREMSLDKVYADIQQQSGFDSLLPFSPDGRGNYYCLDLQKVESECCDVMFWQANFSYSDIAEIEICNNSFVEWCLEVLIEWNTELYNYDGTVK